MSKTAITEEMHIEKEWREQACQQTLETLPEFIRHLMNDYQHDYGTVCYAIGACAAAAAWAADCEPGGGLRTGRRYHRISGWIRDVGVYPRVEVFEQRMRIATDQLRRHALSAV